MKEELNTKMHSEFNISSDDEIKFNVFSCLKVVSYDDKYKLEKYCKIYNVSLADIDKHKDEFYKLRG